LWIMEVPIDIRSTDVSGQKVYNVYKSHKMIV